MPPGVQIVPRVDHMTDDLVLRNVLACYFGFVALFYTARLLALRARTGFSHADPGPKGTANHRHHALFRLFRATILLVCVARVPWPELDRWLLPISGLATPPLALAGVALMVGGLGLVIYVQGFLGAEWRSGIGGVPVRRLVVDGPYARSRNPIFLGVLAGQVGFFLALPSVFTLVCLVVGAVVIRRQAVLEEAELTRRFPIAYPIYRASTPRWIGLASLRRLAVRQRAGA